MWCGFFSIAPWVGFRPQLRHFHAIFELTAASGVTEIQDEKKGGSQAPAQAESAQLALGQEERGLLPNFHFRGVHCLDLEVNLVGALLASIRRNPNDGIEGLQRGGRNVDFCCAVKLDAWHAVNRDLEAMGLFGGVHDLQGIDVFDAAIVGFASQR